MKKDHLDIILVINCGSSSLKFQLFSMDQNEKVLANGLVERIGIENPNFIFKRLADGNTIEQIVDITDHSGALAVLSKQLVDPETGVLKSLAEIDAIGHRVLHGGSKMTASIEVDETVKTKIRECFPLGPLHNPANLSGIEACEENMPGVPNVAVFDTAFHQTMPPEYGYYAIPREIFEKYDVKKYGFHGTSHRYVTQAAATFLNRPLDELNIITCHLGNGSSCAAIKNGKVLDTSMGLTPLQGLVMGSRCGDMDPAVVMYLIRRGMDVDAIDKLLNKQSGLLGVSESGSGDMRDLITAKENGNPQAKLAYDMFEARLVSYIGSYYAALQKPEAVIFTGGIGENSTYAREHIIKKLGIFGCHLDAENNKRRGETCYISTEDSELKAIVIPTNEELMIARDTVDVITTN